MTSATVSPSHYAILAGLPVDQLLALKATIGRLIMQKQRASISYGDYCIFEARGALRMIRVERINPKTISGPECEPKSRMPLPGRRQWRVHPTFLKKVSERSLDPLTPI